MLGDLNDLTAEKVCEAFCEGNEEGFQKSFRELCDYHEAKLHLEPPF